MRRILLGLFLIVGASAAIATGATGAFFSDSESSLGNTFAAGAIDLKVDNDSYYNGNRCTNVGTVENPYFQWQGNASFPEPNTPCDTSFPLSDLDSGLLFFNFTDLKPDDEGEDTISLHVENDAYACMDLTLTSNDDNSSNDPELATPDVQEDINNTWDVELAQNLQFFWWADDGDNVYEDDEGTISSGIKTLYDLATTTTFSVALADAGNNVWTGAPGPMPANETRYIGKAWCFGTMTLDAVPAGEGENPSVDPGVHCDGTALNNLTQTDGATVDVAFRAIQARHNTEFLCGGEDTEPRLAKITVTKVVTNNDGGDNVIGDFQLSVDNGTTQTAVTSGVQTTVSSGSYQVKETGVSGYEATFSGDCDLDGNVVLNDGAEKSCTITNDDLRANITLIKNVINNNGGTASSTSFNMRVDGTLVPTGGSRQVTSNANHFITEDAKAGYHFVSITGVGCPASTSTPVVLNEGEAITCTITNDDDVPPLLTDNFGTGTCLSDIPGWNEDPGESCTNGTVAAAIGTGDDTASPDGGRFALIGNTGYICRPVNATGLQNLVLQYYWRGDNDAEVPDAGLVQYFTGGTCAAPTGLVQLASHSLTSLVWSPLQSINLPLALDNTSFFIRFESFTGAGTESFRVDGVTITGAPI